MCDDGIDGFDGLDWEDWMMIGPMSEEIAREKKEQERLENSEFGEGDDDKW